MKVIISGYGKMGHMIEGICLRRNIEVVECSEDICSVDPAVARECICIDFTTPDAWKANYAWIAANFKAVVVGTTGWDAQREEIFAEFEKNNCPLIYSSNYSLGVNAVFAALEKISKTLSGAGYVPHIEELHHAAKLDAPSGTAKKMAEIVNNGMGILPDITSIRQGDAAGTHTVKFKGPYDKIKISHEAFSREGFAEGAVVAAVLASTLLDGVHEFKDLILC